MPVKFPFFLSIFTAAFFWEMSWYGIHSFPVILISAVKCKERGHHYYCWYVFCELFERYVLHGKCVKWMDVTFVTLLGTQPQQFTDKFCELWCQLIRVDTSSTSDCVHFLILCSAGTVGSDNGIEYILHFPICCPDSV